MSENEKSRCNENILISKIILYAREKNGAKFLKYLLQAKRMCSISQEPKFEVTLRKRGALQAIEIALQNLIEVNSLTSTVMTVQQKDSGCGVNEKNYSKCKILEQAKMNNNIFTAALSILGNAFALDYKARKEASLIGFMESLHKCIRSIDIIETSGSEVLTKAVKCLANWSNDSSCRNTIYRSRQDIPATILGIVEQLHAKNKPTQKILSGSDMNLNNPDKADDGILCAALTQQDEALLCATVRAIRILTTSSDLVEFGRTQSFRFEAITIVGNILRWEFIGGYELGNNLKLDIMRTLAGLTEKVKSIPCDIFNEPLVIEPDSSILGKVINVFETSEHHHKLFDATIRFLHNLSSIHSTAGLLGRHGVFEVVLKCLNSTSDKSVIELLLRLVSKLAKVSENKFQLSRCSHIQGTLKILENQELRECHGLLLEIYESLFEQSLTSMLPLGLIYRFNQILLEEGGYSDYSSLNRKISSLDDDNCFVHAEHGCSFVPKFRCSSPSYKQVQQEVKEYLQARDSVTKNDTLRDFGEIASSGQSDSLSPSSSPAYSWSSGSARSSPVNSSFNGASNCSPISSLSEDEGHYSPEYSSSPTTNWSNPFSDGEDNLENIAAEETLSQLSPAMKRRKLNSGSIQKNISMEVVCDSIPKSTKSLKSSANKIVSVLGILQKCTFFTPMPQDLVIVAPVLLSIILSGKISMGLIESGSVDLNESQYDVECQSLGRKSYDLAFKILKSMFSNFLTFPECVKNKIVILISRMLALSTGKGQNGCSFQEHCKLLMRSLTGVDNETAGWREGFLLRRLLVSKCEKEIANIAVNIPLLYGTNNPVFRKFQNQGKYWNTIFDLLLKTDEITFTQFQECILAICCICETLGMKWTEAGSCFKKPLLKKCTPNSGIIACEREDGNLENNDLVLFELDDGSKISSCKEVLTTASPVFSAMFNGHFIETGEQKVQLRKISRTALLALLEQIELLQAPNNNEMANSNESNSHNTLPCSKSMHDLSTLFELLSLADQFLLEQIYERTLNTLVSSYICPYSAPIIYTNAVKLGALFKPEDRQPTGQFSLTFLILKYLLVGENISVTVKCGAFWKIFDSVLPSVVVGDLRALVEFYSSNIC